MVNKDNREIAIKSGDVEAIRHDPHFLYFVVRYKQAYNHVPSYSEAVQLYREYDTEWLTEIAEYEQTLQFVRDTDTRDMILKG